jgi:hypothetical protein
MQALHMALIMACCSSRAYRLQLPAPPKDFTVNCPFQQADGVVGFTLVTMHGVAVRGDIGTDGRGAWNEVSREAELIGAAGHWP